MNSSKATNNIPAEMNLHGKLATDAENRFQISPVETMQEVPCPIAYIHNRRNIELIEDFLLKPVERLVAQKQNTKAKQT
jgi:hypothetical protein